MAHKITDACVNCGACESECPVNAISEKNGVRWIDPATCTDCDACTSSCPVEAIIQG
ncbi:MAG: 4Fe-4S binding protein [Spirochaetes bacterium]|nr:4Fe-4S binding protein [Spirochaetota bacterium]